MTIPLSYFHTNLQGFWNLKSKTTTQNADNQRYRTCIVLRELILATWTTVNVITLWWRVYFFGAAFKWDVLETLIWKMMVAIWRTAIIISNLALGWIGNIFHSTIWDQFKKIKKIEKVQVLHSGLFLRLKIAST